MAIFKCKMCGGALEINNNETVATCEYCGTQQTLPKLDDDRRANLYDRANHFRRNNEFDKAIGIYEQILNEDNTDAESYWSLVLCRYGIEYVEDPSSHKRIPTVNRAQFTSIFDDSNYKSALEYADGYQRTIYEEEAKAINEIQKGILAISQKEEPFDVFICYKESDNNGRRTPDSVLAQELYYQLKQEGFKVFFSRITLEDKLGTAYEPYIFAALNSSKVMVVLGTKPEHFNAVWVKNEWSRYLSLIKNGAKKVLIPAYKDMDPYDLPDEFSHLQAQDMSKLGFMQDLIRGISKLAQTEAPKTTVVTETVVTNEATNIAPLLKRVFMFLEDGNWSSADEYCEKVLDIDPECAEAYLGKLMAELRVRKQESLKDCAVPFDNSNSYQKAVRFGDDKLKSVLNSYIEHINTRNEIARKDNILAEGKAKMKSDIVTDYESAIELFESISGWKDADEQIRICKNRIEEIYAEEEVKRIEREQKAEADRIERERQKELARIKEEEFTKFAIKVVIILMLIPFAIIMFVIIGVMINSNINYNKAVELMDNGNYKEAIEIFTDLDDYKDSKELISLSNEKHLAPIREKLRINETISAGAFHTVALKSDGTVVAACDNDFSRCNIDDWTDIIAISAGSSHTVGLKSDGTVVATADSLDSKIKNWTDIVAISAGSSHTVGLKSDGTVVAVGDNEDGQCEVSDWTNIVAISADSSRTVGLKSDGTVVAVGSNSYGKCNVDDWTDIIAIAAGNYHTVGLKSDGTVVAVGDNDFGQCDIDGWTDIIAISAGNYHTVGLKADGTVVAVGYNENGQCNVDDWTDIAAISTDYAYTIGLKSNGTVVVVGGTLFDQGEVNAWTNIKLPKNK